MSDTIYTLYWIHTSEHTDPYSQGYVGITKRGIEKRFQEHKKHKNLSDDYIIEELYSSSNKQKISDLEKEYRPDFNIGMNKNIGGLDVTFYPDMPKDEEWKRKIALSNSKPKDKKGRKACQENSKKACDAWRGQSHTEEHKKHIRKLMSEYWTDRPRPLHRKKVYGDGIVYESLSIAAETLGVSRQTIHNRIKNDKFDWHKL